MDPSLHHQGGGGRGTGLGLSMVYGFAKQSGGAAWIDFGRRRRHDRLDGSFPPSPTPLPDRAGDRGIALDRPGDETILVVEDRHDVREMARAVLLDLGYTVIVGLRRPCRSRHAGGACRHRPAVHRHPAAGRA